MPTCRRLSLFRIALAVAIALTLADRASAAPILLSNLQVDLDQVGLVATVRAGITAQADVFLDALTVDLSQNGSPIADLFAGPTLLDAQPFFDLPFSLLAGEIIPDGTALFRITGLVANAAYAGSFALLQFDPDGASILASRSFAFSTVPAPVPEPATLLLFASGVGATGWLERRRRASSARRTGTSR
jgi:hypothetical protein